MGVDLLKVVEKVRGILVSAGFGCVLLVGVVGLRHSVVVADEKKGSEEARQTERAYRIVRPDHNHPAFSERKGEREQLVARHIERPAYSAGVRDPNVLRAMRTVPRHAFVRERDSRRAYADHPLPIGYNQTISQPYIVAYMTELLQLDPNATVLEVGTGSGYQAAVCAEIAARVYTIEIVEQLAKSSSERLGELGYHNVVVRKGDGFFGWAEKGPFDAIIITAATGIIPPPLTEQLKPGGKMILPLGSPYSVQTLVLVEKSEKGKVTSRSLLPVRFVPMLGRALEGERQGQK